MFGLSAVRFYMTGEPSFYFTCYPGLIDDNDVAFFYQGANTAVSFWYTYTRWIYFICNDSQYPYFNSVDMMCY